MGENKEGENWQSNPSLSGIDPDKMRFLTQMMGEVGGKESGGGASVSECTVRQ